MLAATATPALSYLLPAPHFSDSQLSVESAKDLKINVSNGPVQELPELILRLFYHLEKNRVFVFDVVENNREARRVSRADYFDAGGSLFEECEIVDVN